MSINLLPSEEKSKFGKIKYQPAPIIEMTGPVEVKKIKPADKRGGVLGFFKQAFAKPKPVSPDAMTPLPEKKIAVEERIVFQKQKPQETPRPIIKIVAPKPERTQARRSQSIGERLGNFFRNMFGGKSKVPAVAPKVPPAPVADTFPKYRPIRAEKISTGELARTPKSIEVITVTTNGKQPETARAMSSTPPAGRRLDIPYEGFPKNDPAFKAIKQTSVPAPQAGVVRMSVWQKIARWFGKLFARAPKQKIVPMIRPAADSQPKSPEPSLGLRTEQKIALPTKPAPAPPPPPLPKPAPAVQPLTPSFIRPSVLMTKSVEPKLVLEKKDAKAAPRPGMPHLSVWQKIARWFRKLFSRTPKQKIVPIIQPETPDKPKVTVPPAVSYTEKTIFSPRAPAVPPVAPSFIRPSVPMARPVEQKFTQEKISIPSPHKPFEAPPVQKPVSVPVPPPPAAPAKTAATPPPAAPAPEMKKDVNMPWWRKIWNIVAGKFRAMKLTNKKIAAKQPGSIQNIPGVRLTDVQVNGSKISPIEWEVNLVPEEAVDKELPISKILIGAMCIIISIGIVFGGWIAANYYYSNVTARVSGLNGQIASNRIEINSYQTVQKNVRELNQSMGNIETLLQKHVYWSGIFNKLENYTVAEVYYTSMTADVNGAVALNAIGRNYESAVKQLEVFKRAADFVSKVTVTGICFAENQQCLGGGGDLLITPTKETIKFSVNLMVQPSIFYWPK
ncbi:MAG: hypothetical protein V1668_01690 [Patescibacteria group bacterium]